MKIQLANVRAAFLHVFEPQAPMAGSKSGPKFGGQFIIDPSSDLATALDKAVVETANGKWGAKASAILAEMRKTDRVCYRHGPKTNDSGDVYEGFEGMHYVSASSSKRPLVIDRDKTPLSQADGKPYSGCYVNAVLEIWAQDNQFGKRINAELKGVQFVKDGDAFGGGTPANPDDFEDLGVPAEESSLV